MGWTTKQATRYKNDGSIDRKAELDECVWGNSHEVLKSAMVGSTYYAAVKIKETGEVFAAVFLTSTDHGDFSYNYLPETCGPCDAACPVSILDLLTETKSEFAIAWREQCRQHHANKKAPTFFDDLPLGTKVVWTVPHESFTNLQKGQQIELVKRKVGRIGKRLTTCWVNEEGHFGVKPKDIKAEDVEIVA